MKTFTTIILRRIWKDEQGQSMFLMAFTLSAVLGLSGLSVEVGHGYFAYKKLVASTKAAALAGAAVMPDTVSAATYIQRYSSASGGLNTYPQLQSVVATPTFLCLTTVTSSLKTPCVTSTGSSGGYNAVRVTQTANLTTWFGGLFGVRTMNLSATATAAMRGGTASPWNIAIVLDTTASMASKDSGVQCSGTQISCALLGVQALVSDLYPCAMGADCTAGGAAFDSVALYVLPPILASTATKDTTCPSGAPTHEYYMVPTLNSLWTYQVVNFSSNYRITDTASALNASSSLGIASGAGSCAGISAPGGAGTYYAEVIYKAQSDLVAKQALVTGSRNAMIILTDGDATASTSYTGSGKTAVFSSSSQLQPSSAGALNGITGNNPTSPTYPSAVGECGQAVMAAQSAATAGTVVFTIGYGSPTSGCTTDKTYSPSVTTGGGTWAAGYSPCQALGAMASQPVNFYSDNASGCAATVPSNAAITQLTSIFHQITANMTNSRLIPNGTT